MSTSSSGSNTHILLLCMNVPPNPDPSPCFQAETRSTLSCHWNPPPDPTFWLGAGAPHSAEPPRPRTWPLPNQLHQLREHPLEVTVCQVDNGHVATSSCVPERTKLTTTLVKMEKFHSLNESGQCRMTEASVSQPLSNGVNFLLTQSKLPHPEFPSLSTIEILGQMLLSSGPSWAL